MLKLNVTTKMTPEQVIKSALRFFGPEGYGLEVQEQSNSRISLHGGGGRVEIYALTEGTGTSVDLVTREWEYKLKEFAGTLK